MQCSLSQTFLFWDSQIEICEHGLFPDDVSTIFMKFSLKSSASPFSSLAMSPSFPILIQSFSMQLLFVKKGFTVFEKVLLDITPLLVASLKNFLLDFLVTELHELHLFLAFCKLQNSPKKATLHICFYGSTQFLYSSPLISLESRSRRKLLSRKFF